MKAPRHIISVSSALSTVLIMHLLCPLPALPQPVPPRQDPAKGDEQQDGRNDPLSEEALHRMFLLANQAYLDGTYEKAAAMYEKIRQGGHSNGHIFYNLGNCYVRMNKLGKAILNYHKALILMPRDGDCKANLRYARGRTMDRIEDVGEASLWHTLAFWYFGLNFQELLICFLALHTLFWIAALLRLSGDREWVKWVFALSLILSIVMGASGILKYRDTRFNRLGVILVEEANVRSGYSQQDTVLFLLHEGAEVQIIGEENGWHKIQLPDGKKGWITKEYMGRASLPL